MPSSLKSTASHIPTATNQRARALDKQPIQSQVVTTCNQSAKQKRKEKKSNGDPICPSSSAAVCREAQPCPQAAQPVVAAVNPARARANPRRR
ncbi:hypothetical protein M0R45_006812 [Rubus argutus]|uniref:Uncharacterized protein n=1 Tax=Rubus argutus TaxID=59490 RepID=A0AAW1YRL8_RUBAR